MKEPTYKQHLLLSKASKEGGLHRNGNEPDVGLLYNLVAIGMINNCVSPMGPKRWIFKVTPSGEEYLRDTMEWEVQNGFDDF